MIFHRSQKHVQSQSIDLNIGNNIIARTSSIRFIGVPQDDHLSQADYVTYIVKKVAKYVSILRRVKECLPRFAIKMVYHVIIYPHFHYCCTIRGGCNKTTIKPLQKLQYNLISVIGRGTRL